MKIPKYCLVLGLFINNAYSEILVITDPKLQQILGPKIYIVSSASQKANKNKEILLKTKHGPSMFLEGVNLMGADLKNANLEGAKLRGAILINTNLTGANLKGADLQGVLMHIANARSADFTNANLSQVKAYNADFENAKFVKAKLTLARMHDSKFREANLQGADMDNANFARSDFRTSNINNAKALHTNLANTDFTDSIGNLSIIYTDFNSSTVCCTKTGQNTIESISTNSCDWQMQQECDKRIRAAGMNPSEVHKIFKPSTAVSNPDPQSK